MTTVLCHVRDDEGQASRLAAALDIVRQTGGHITCIQALSITAYMPTDPVFIPGAFLQETLEREQRLREAVEARLTREAVCWNWIELTGRPAEQIVRHSGLADVVVLSRAVREFGPGEPLPLVGEVVLAVRSPVLAVPPGIKAVNMAGRALVAWNGSPEAASVLRAARPFLRQARGVHVISVTEPGSTAFPPTAACEYLSRHGIHAALHDRHAAPDDVGDALLRGVGEVDAAFVVMGAYGRPRALELLLGGVTRHMLARCPVPLLLAH